MANNYKVTSAYYSNSRADKEFRVVINRCDLCDDAIPCHEDREAKISMLKEIDDSYESEYDKHEPRLMLCDYCQKEYLIPAYPI